ncbi:hypothetical protein Tco_1275733 [Tanacetum coccineum]
MCTYLKNMGGYKHNQLKGRSYEEIQKPFDKIYLQVNTFVPMDSDVVEGSKKAKADTEQESSTKRAGEELEQEKAKKKSIDEHVEEEKESEGLNQCFEIVPEDGDDVTIDATPLSTRSPNIVEKNYPLTYNTLHQMFNDVKLQVDYECEMAYEFLILVKRQLKEGYVPEGGLLGLKDFKMILRVTTAQVKVAGSLFNIKDNKELLLSYNIGSNSFNIIDEDDVDFFLKAILESGDVVMSVFIKSTEKTVEATPSKPLDIDLNIPWFHEPVTHEWIKNSLNYLLPTHHAPILDLKSITTSHHGVKFSAKTKFADKEACMYEIGVKCITEGYEYKVVRSCPQRYAVECVHLDCYWYIFTRRIKKENGFRVTYINDNHTCPKTQFYPNHRNATAKMLCQLIIPKFRDVTRVYRPKDIINDLNIEFNIDVSYKRAWKGKQLALKSNQGDPISSFAQLPYYCYNLKLANENTVTHIDTDHEGRFKMLFIAFGAAVRI